MFPIKDTVHARSFPIMNWLLIIANSLVFIYEINLSPSALQRFTNTFALIPTQIHWNNPFSLLPFITHIFLHAGWLHIISNMWVLFIFGDNVEDRLGSWRYLVFYLLGGIAAGLLQYYFIENTSLPSLGASGAIAAVMGAYLLFYPRSKVITFVPIFLFVWFVEIPSVVFLGIWFLTQAFSGLISLSVPGGAAMGGVAWWAHIGGFIFGLLMAKPFCAGRCKRNDYLDEYHPW